MSDSKVTEYANVNGIPDTCLHDSVTLLTLFCEIMWNNGQNDQVADSNEGGCDQKHDYH